MKRTHNRWLRLVQEPVLLVYSWAFVSGVLVMLTPVDLSLLTFLPCLSFMVSLGINSKIEQYAADHRGTLPRWMRRYLISLNWWSRRGIFGMFFRYGYAAVVYRKKGTEDKDRYLVRFVRYWAKPDLSRRKITKQIGSRLVWDLGPYPRLEEGEFFYGVPLEVKLHRTRRAAERDMAYLVLKGDGP